MNIQIKTGSICSAKVDAIVNPANCYGVMCSEVGKAILKIGGQEIEDEAIHQSPINIGDILVTSAGQLVANMIIHAPTMEQPMETADPDIVVSAIQSVLEYAVSHQLRSLAFAAMGCGTGGLDKKQGAHIMISTLKAHTAPFPDVVELYSLDADMLAAWKEEL